MLGMLCMLCAHPALGPATSVVVAIVKELVLFFQLGPDDRLAAFVVSPHHG